MRTIWNENPDPLADLQDFIEKSQNTGLVLRDWTIDDLRNWASSWPLGWLWVKLLKEMYAIRPEEEQA